MRFSRLSQSPTVEHFSSTFYEEKFFDKSKRQASLFNGEITILISTCRRNSDDYSLVIIILPRNYDYYFTELASRRFA